MPKPTLHLVPRTRPRLRLVPKPSGTPAPERLSGTPLFATPVAVTFKEGKLHAKAPLPA